MSLLGDLVVRHGANKPAYYLPTYTQLLAFRRWDELNLLELGVATGGSLLVWRDYLPRARVTGLDRQLPALDEPGDRVRMYAGQQDDEALLTRIADERGPFDVVIDDCSHVASATAASMRVLWPRLRGSGSLYVIEDWGTGYWPEWPDGAAFAPGHTAGMVGLVKDLVDAVGREMAADSGYARLTIEPGLAVAEKA